MIRRFRAAGTGRHFRRAKKRGSQRPRGARCPLSLESLEPRQLLSAAPIIGEFLASNKAGLKDSFGEYSDWLEIHNPDSQQAVDLTNWQLRHKGTNWTFPAMGLGPGETRIIFASGRNLTDPNGELHASFNLDKDGASLKLLDALGTVVHEYAPFPAQQADISYGVGQTVTETKLLAAGAAARYFVPTDSSLGSTWKDLGFNDAGWTQATVGLGYAELVPGFAVRGYKASAVSSIGNLAAAQAVIDNPANQSWLLSETAATVNYLSTGGAGHFLYDRAYPGATIGIAQSNYVIKAVGKIHVFPAGTWTFGVNSDDGFRLSIAGAAFTSVSGTGTTIVSGAMQLDGSRTAADSLGVVTFAAAGDYDLELLYYQSTSTAEVELFAAQGSYTSWNATTNWRLVGDAAPGGLAVLSAPFTGAANSVASRVETDVRAAVQQAGNNSVYTRITFDAPDWQSLSTLTLKMAYDDGYVAYLNGVEIARRNAPATVTWNTRALAERQSEVQASTFETVDITTFLDPSNPEHLLEAGNVLAIQVLGAAAADGDLLVAPEIAQITSTSAGLHYFTTPTPGGANSREYWQKAADPEFSVEHGFYDQPFELSLWSDTAGASIYYTLDGSDPLSPHVPRSVSGITRSGTTATVTSNAHGYAEGALVQVSGAAQPEYNGVFSISGVAANTFNYTVPGTAVTPASGNVVALKVDKPVSGIVRDGATARAAVAAHGYGVGDLIRIAGAAQAEYNGDFVITAVTADTFSYALTGTPATPATPAGGTIGATRLGQQYAAPLAIGTTTVVRAAAFRSGCEPSNGVASTYVFVDDVIRQPALPDGFPAMWSTWPADYEMDPRITDDPAYRGVVADALLSLPSMSLVTHQDHLFDAQYGIYANTATSLNETYNGPPLRAPASLEYFQPGGGEDFQITAGVQIYGGWGRKPEYKKHSFRLVFQSEYGPTKLESSLLGDGAVEQFDTLILRAQFNDSWPAGGSIIQYIRDAFGTDSHLAMGQPDHHSRWVHLYVDGLYWGIYQVTERPDDAFAASYMGGDKDDWEFNNSGYADGSTAGLPAWNELMAKTNWGFSATAYQAGAPGFNATYYVAAGSANPGFTSIYYKANVAVNNLADAESVIATPSKRTSISQHDISVINYLNNGADGHFTGGNLGFPGAGTTPTDNFVVEITSSLTISTAGYWTFGVSSNDGFRLTLTNGTETYTITNDIAPSGPTDKIQALNIAAAGNYRLRLVYFQKTGGAELELFAAQGNYSSWGATTDWKLIGDPALAGLAAYTIIPLASLSDAEAILSTSSRQAWVRSHVAGTVNYYNAGADGRYTSGNIAFPGTTINTSAQSFVVKLESTIYIPTTGQWTFGVNSDDGFHLELFDGPTRVLDSSFDGLRTAADTFTTVNFTKAGPYTLRLVYYQGATAGAGIELFAAKGSFSSWSATTSWQLVGSNVTSGTNPGLLSLASVVPVTSLDAAENVISQPSLTAGGVRPRTAISGITRSGTTATATLANHGFVNGQTVVISGASQPEYNGTWVIANVTADTFDYTITGTPASPATGALLVQPVTAAVTDLRRSAQVATATVPNHGFVNGQTIRITGANQAEYNGTLVISGVTADTFSYTISGSPASPATGTIFAQPYGICRNGATAIVMLPGHGYANGDVVVISGSSQGQYNGTYAVTNATASTFSYVVSGAPASPATGTITVRKNVQAWSSTQSQVNVINYLSTGSDGHFGTNNLFPGTSGAGSGALLQNLVVEAKTTLSIPSAGPWTFGVHSDEGFRLTLSNGSDTFTAEYDRLRTPGDTFATFQVTQPGAYRLRLVYFQNAAGAEVELFAAPGAWTAWSQTNAWRLVGDHAKGGLGTGLYDFAAATVYRANVPVTTLAAAREVINDPARQSAVDTEYRNTVNFVNTGGDGHYAGSAAFPGMTPGDPQTEIDNFVVRVQADVNLTAAGQWTFGVFCDDGFSLKLLDGVTLIDELQYDGLRGMTDTLKTFSVPRAGRYMLELVYYQHVGEAGLELFAAQGAHAAFSPGVFRLVGDTSQGGLAVGSGVDNTAMFFALMGMNPDGTRNPNYPVLLDVHNYIDYMLVNFYLGMGDWPHHNFYAARPNDPGSTGYKFFCWDAEWSIGLSSTLTQNQTGVSAAAARPYYYLAAVPEFRMTFADHVYKHLFNGGALTPEASIARYRELAETVQWAIILESARWGDVQQTTPDTPDMWRNQRDWALNTYLPQRTAIVVQQLRDAALYPSIDAPAFAVNGVSKYGGTFLPGDTLTIVAPAGTIYYTLDGSDPRLPGGTLSPAALTHTTPIALSQGVQVKARAFSNGEWSALADAGFYPDLAPSIRISELMYNPAPPSPDEIAAGWSDNNQFEYVEIQNIGSQTLPLGGLRLTSGVDFTFPNVNLAPGEHKLIVADAGAFRFRYGAALQAIFGSGWEGLLVAGQYAGRLDSAGEKVRLEAPVGGIILEFTYQDGWYSHTDGEGFSLTVRNPAQDRSLWDRSEGWRASAAPGGTPGYSDTLVAPGSIIVNEVLSHSSAAEGDMIELCNTTDEPIDVGGWFVSDGASDLRRYQIAAGTLIAPHGYLVLIESRHFGNLGDPGCRTPFALSEHGDDVYLSSNAGALAGGYREHVDFGGAPDGVSTGLHTRSTGGTDFTLLQTPTFGAAPDYLGAANSIPYSSPLVFNEIMYHPAAPTAAELAAGFDSADDFEFLELYSRSETALTLSNFHVGDGVGFTFGWYPDGTGSEVWTLEPGATASWTAVDLQNDTYTVYAHFTLVDGDGKRRTLDDDAQYTITAAGGSTTVTIDQNQPTLPTTRDVWVNLGVYAFNGTGTVRLARGATGPGNWTIADQVKFIGTGHEVVVSVATLDSFATRSGRTTLAPGEYLVLVSNYAAFDARYGVAAHNIPVAGVYSGNLDNGGEMLRLYVAGNLDPGVIPRYDIDRVNYSDQGAWPSKPDGEGPALMRIHPAAYGNDAVNWRATNVGGTPGAANVPIDKLPPSVPANVAGVAAVTPGVHIHLTWTASVAPQSYVDHYLVYRDGILVGTPSTAAYVDNDVQAVVPYVYEIVAVNRDGYESERSAAVTVSVPGIAGYLLPDATHVEISFGEPLNPATAADPGRYVFSGGSLAGVALAANNTRVILTTAAPMTLNAAYTVTMNGLTTLSGSELPAGLELALTFVPQGAGYILREYWTGITGTAVTNLTGSPNYPANPSGQSYLTSFEAPVNWADNYGTRIRGYVVPPATGGYTFWIASDDSSQLWLSTDDDPAHKTLIASVTGWTGSREWTKYGTQYNATPINLVAGRRYYIEALQKEGSGGDSLAVRWQLPGGAWENNDSNLPIPGTRLSPYGPVADVTPPSAPASLRATITNNSEVALAWNAAEDPDGIVSQYVIYRDGQAYGYATTTGFVDTAVSPTARHLYQVAAWNADGLEGPRSTPLALAPLGISAAVSSGPTTVHLSFTEPLDRATAEQAASYELRAGKTVLSLGLKMAVSGITSAGATATATLPNHGLVEGQTILISGATPSQYNGTFTIFNVQQNTFSYTMASAPGSSASGTISAQPYGISSNGTTAVVWSPGHGFSAGEQVLMFGADQPAYNGAFTLTAATANTFSYSVTATPASAATGAAIVAVRSGAPAQAPTAARLEGDGLTVTLTTPLMSFGSGWLVSLGGVQTREGTLLPAGVQQQFTYGGGILREYWLNAGSGTAVSDLTGSAVFPNGLTGREVRTQFESPVNQLTNSGERMRGYVVPESTGDYYFYIASDDSGQLWLSTDEGPANKTLVASVTGSTGSREWTKYASQKSTLIHLAAGQRYYIEAIQKQGSGGSNLAVAWQRSGTTFDGLPIQGTYLAPAAPYVDALPLLIAVAPRGVSDPTPKLDGTVSDPAAAVTVRVDGVYYAAVNHGNNTWELPGNALQGPLPDGTHQVTAWVADGYGRLGFDAAADDLVIDTVVPTASIDPLSPNPRNIPVAQVQIVFSEPIVDFDLADLRLTRDGGSDLLTGAETLATTDSRTWTFGGLTDLTARPGAYLLELSALGSGIEDPGENHLLGDAAIAWTVDTTAPTAEVGAVSPDPRATSVPQLPITFSETVAGFDLEDLRLTKNGSVVSLVGATLGSSDNVIWTLGNLAELTGRAGDYTLTLVAGGSDIRDLAGNPLSADAAAVWRTNATVVGRYVCYNGSAFDGRDPAANTQDFDAMATDKQPLFLGDQADYDNYTSYSRGINGIIVDIRGLADPQGLVAADFAFRTGNDNYPLDDPGTWVRAATPTTVRVFAGAGLGGSDRVTILWPDGAIQNQWLEVTVQETTRTGLSGGDVFYFGNAIGETGNNRSGPDPNAVVDSADEEAARSNKTTATPELITNLYDFNRDRRVNAADELIARNNYSPPGQELRLIDLSGGGHSGGGLMRGEMALPSEEPFPGQPAAMVLTIEPTTPPSQLAQWVELVGGIDRTRSDQATVAADAAEVYWLAAWVVDREPRRATADFLVGPDWLPASAPTVGTKIEPATVRLAMLAPTSPAEPETALAHDAVFSGGGARPAGSVDDPAGQWLWLFDFEPIGLRRPAAKGRLLGEVAVDEVLAAFGDSGAE